MRWAIVLGEVEPGRGPATRRTGPAFLHARETIELARGQRDTLLVTDRRPRDRWAPGRHGPRARQPHRANDRPAAVDRLDGPRGRPPPGRHRGTTGRAPCDRVRRVRSSRCPVPFATADDRSPALGDRYRPTAQRGMTADPTPHAGVAGAGAPGGRLRAPDRPHGDQQVRRRTRGLAGARRARRRGRARRSAGRAGLRPPWRGVRAGDRGDAPGHRRTKIELTPPGRTAAPAGARTAADAEAAEDRPGPSVDGGALAALFAARPAGPPRVCWSAWALLLAGASAGWRSSPMRIAMVLARPAPPRSTASC